MNEGVNVVGAFDDAAALPGVAGLLKDWLPIL